jgi:hypothetical protein
LLVRIKDIARDGEQIMDRSSGRRGSGSAYAVLMRSLLLPQVSRIRPHVIAAATPRLLDLIVPGSDDFFQRLAPENWPCTSRMLPLSVRIPVLAGVATVSRRPEGWIGKLVGAAAPPHRASVLHCLEALAFSNHAELPATRPPDSGYCGNFRNLWPKSPGIKWQQLCERALFR